MRATKLFGFFSEIGNTRAGQTKKSHGFFLGRPNARPKSNARAHLKQRKKHSGLDHLLIRPSCMA